MSLFRKALVLNAAEGISFALGVARTVILARFLGPDGVGQYAVHMSLIMLGAQLFACGIPASFLLHSRREPEHAGTYLATAACVLAASGLVGGGLAGCLVIGFPSYFGILPFYGLLAVSAAVPINLARVAFRNALLVRLAAKRLAVVSVVSVVTGVLFILVLVAAGWFGVGQALLCFSLAPVTGIAMAWFWTRGDFAWSWPPRITIVKRLVAYGIRQSWADLMVLVNAQLSIMIIKLFMHDFESVGYFDRGQRLAVLLVIAGQGVLPLLFSRWASLGEREVAPHVERVLRFMTTFGAGAAVFILVSGKWLILLLYGRAFLPAAGPMQILVIGAGLYLLSLTLMQLLGSRGAPQLSAMALMLSAAANAGLCCLLIDYWGIRGAAWASLLGNGVLFASLIVVVRRRYAIVWTRCVGIRRVDYRSFVLALRRGKDAEKVHTRPGADRSSL